MSTYYKFICTECEQSGGFLSVQMWGAGNFDIIDTYKFLMHHAIRCGVESIRMVWEHGENYDLPKTPPQEMLDTFPRSDDWGFVGDRHGESWSRIMDEWHREHYPELFTRKERLHVEKIDPPAIDSLPVHARTNQNPGPQ